MEYQQKCVNAFRIQILGISHKEYTNKRYFIEHVSANTRVDVRTSTRYLIHCRTSMHRSIMGKVTIAWSVICLFVQWIYVIVIWCFEWRKYYYNVLFEVSVPCLHSPPSVTSSRMQTNVHTNEDHVDLKLVTLVIMEITLLKRRCTLSVLAIPLRWSL